MIGQTGADKMEPGQSKPFCRRCLLEDMPENEYFKSLKEYIAHLDETIKVSEEVYEERLSLCRQCDQLLNGMCRQCGCFVELRAAVRKNYCPAADKRWDAKIL